MKHWEIKSKVKNTQSKLSIDEIIQLLLANRGLEKPGDIENFLHPTLAHVTSDAVGIDKKQVAKAIKRITTAISEKEQMIVFGDYDVDGITGSAILWESLRDIGAQVKPYIPHRVDEGYGLSMKGIENVKHQYPDVKVIITVDNGIVAHDAVDFANTLGIDVIITDHHTVGSEIPNAHAIVHTTQLCGAGVAWIFTKELNNKKDNKQHLDLVALATVADLVPLTGANRTLLTCGLSVLRKTTRIGLQSLFQEAGVIAQYIGVYEIGHIIAPRLNAMGRLESAMDSLRLLCTNNKERAENLAHLLGETNRGRQLLTKAASLHAIEYFKNIKIKNILIHEYTYEEGIIGLVAGKLVETYYRPAIVIAKGEKTSKASARSISGFNIIEFIRKSSHLLINAGGHPMAAGFTIETEKIPAFKEFLENLSIDGVTEDMLVRRVKIDCELPFDAISQELYIAIQALAPFGMGNPEPTFVSDGIIVDDIKYLGREKNHVKFILSSRHSGEAQSADTRIPLEYKRDSGQARMTNSIEAIGFGMADIAKNIKVGDAMNIVYTIDENEWNGRKKLQLKIKDIKTI